MSDPNILFEIKQRVESLEWYHTMDLGNGIVTPGHYDHQPYLKYYGFAGNLSGKKVLDIGAGSGFFSFEFERRGAKVLATDLPEWMAHDFGPKYTPDKTPHEGAQYLDEPFELAKQLLHSKVERLKINIYDISPETVGTFDLVFCGSLLLHLTNPIKGLCNIRNVTRGSAIIATVIWQNPDSEPIAQFVGHHHGDVWWLPNRAGFEAMVQSAGFANWKWISEFYLNYRDGRPGPYHGVIRAWNDEPQGSSNE